MQNARLADSVLFLLKSSRLCLGLGLVVGLGPGLALDLVLVLILVLDLDLVLILTSVLDLVLALVLVLVLVLVLDRYCYNKAVFVLQNYKTKIETTRPRLILGDTSDEQKKPTFES